VRDVSTALIVSSPAVFISDVLPASLDLSGTDSALYPYDREVWLPHATSLYPYFLFPPSNTRHSHPHGTGTGTSHTDTQHLSVEESLNTPLDYDETDVKLTSSYSGSISVKVIAANGNATAFEGIESQLENPLVGIRGAKQKDINALRHELQRLTATGNNSYYGEDGESRSANMHYPPENSKVHSSTYPKPAHAHE
jgi:hypothetical protein